MRRLCAHCSRPFTPDAKHRFGDCCSKACAQAVTPRPKPQGGVSLGYVQSAAPPTATYPRKHGVNRKENTDA